MSISENLALVLAVAQEAIASTDCFQTDVFSDDPAGKQIFADSPSLLLEFRSEFSNAQDLDEFLKAVHANFTAIEQALPGTNAATKLAAAREISLEGPSEVVATQQADAVILFDNIVHLLLFSAILSSFRYKKEKDPNSQKTVVEFEWAPLDKLGRFSDHVVRALGDSKLGPRITQMLKAFLEKPPESHPDFSDEQKPEHGIEESK